MNIFNLKTWVHYYVALLNRLWAFRFSLILAVAILPLLLYSFTLRLPFMGEDHFGYAALSRELYTVGDTYRVDVVIDPKIVRAYPQLVPWWTSPDAKLVFLRPLTNLFVKLDYRIWKKDPFGYHLSNLLLHSLPFYFGWQSPTSPARIQ